MSKEKLDAWKKEIDNNNSLVPDVSPEILDKNFRLEVVRQIRTEGIPFPDPEASEDLWRRSVEFFGNHGVLRKI